MLQHGYDDEIIDKKRRDCEDYAQLRTGPTSIDALGSNYAG